MLTLRACLLMATALFLSSRSAFGERKVCPPHATRVISYDADLLPPENLTASNEDIQFNPVVLLFGRNNVPFNLWCSNGGDGLNHHINATFSSSVVISAMISSGFSNGYVTNFTMEYSEDKESSFTFYQDTQMNKDFVVPQIDTVFMLDLPITAQRLRLFVNDGILSPSGRICWHLVLIGCTLEEAVTVDRNPPVTATVTTTVLIPESSVPTVSNTLPETLVVVKIAAPIAAGTIVIVICIVAIGVLLCIKCSRDKRNWRPAIECSQRSEMTSSGTLKTVDNSTLYNGRSQMTLTSGVTMLSTPGAGSHEGYVLSPTLRDQTSSTDVLETELYTTTYDQIEPVVQASHSDRDSMVDNPHYNIPFPVQPQHSMIDMMTNESYSVPYAEEEGYSYANIETCGAGIRSASTNEINIYDSPRNHN